MVFFFFHYLWAEQLLKNNVLEITLTMTRHLIETIHINWLLLFSHLLWIMGLAIFLALVGLLFYLFPARTDRQKRVAFIKLPVVKMAWIIGFVFVLASPILYSFKLASPDLVVVQVKPRHPGATFPMLHTSQTFTTRELRFDPQNGKHLLNKKNMETGPMFLFWDGYIHTPFLKFAPGNYMVTFQAAGTWSQDSFAKIKVEFQCPDANNYLVTKKRIYIELTEKPKIYRIPFNTKADTIGRVSITFFNDVFLADIRQGRDVWVDEISIHSLKRYE